MAPRRVLTETEWQALIDAAGQRPRPLGSMSGAVRSCWYRVARWTGLRAAALRSLTGSDLQHDQAASRWWIHYRGCKGGDPGKRPLPCDLGHELMAHCVPSALARGVLFTRSRDQSRILSADLAAAGVQPLAAAGRFDFHSIRHMCAVDLRRCGCSLPEIRAWLGHADTRTTERYLRSVLDDELAAVADRRRAAPTMKGAIQWR